MKIVLTLLIIVAALAADVVEVGFQFDSWPNDRNALPVMVSVEAEDGAVDKRDPVQVLYLMDLSEITTGVVKREFINGAIKIAESLKESDWFGVVLYSDYPRVLFPLSEMSETKKTDLKKVLENLSTEKGRDLFKTVQKIDEQFSLKEIQNTISKEVIITTSGVFTGNVKSDKLKSSLLSQSKVDGFRIHTVSYGDDFDEDMMISLAEESGGRAYFSREREPESLFVAFAEIAHDVANPTVSKYKLELSCEPLKVNKWEDSLALDGDLTISTLPKGGKRYIFLQLTGDNKGSTQFDVNYSYHSLVTGSDVSDAVMLEVPQGSDEGNFNASVAPRLIKNSILSNLSAYDKHLRIGEKEYRRDFCSAFKEKVLFPLESAKGRISTPEMDTVYVEIEILWDQLSRSSNGDLDYVLKKMKYMLHSNKYGR